MSSHLPAIIDVVGSVFSRETITSEASSALESVELILKKSDDPTLTDGLQNHFDSTPLPFDNLCGFHLFLYRITQDPAHLHKAIEAQLPIKTPAAFQELYWNVVALSFTSTDTKKFESQALRDTFQTIALEVNRRVAPAKKTQLKGRPRRIAILSSQIIGMRHSPTREAISIAMHLQRLHGCEVFIFNTNSVNYGNHLNVYKPYIANHNPGLKGLQTTPMDYMSFRAEPITILSFPPERGSTARIGEILRHIEHLAIDAVISHAENLFVQEALFGRYPSIFATTGDVVPYAHSDAYWVPSTLVDAQCLQTAQRNGHADFLMERMFCTPETPSEVAKPREEFGCSAADFVLLCVSTRLADEVTSDFVRAMIHILESHPRAKLVFAGSPDVRLDTWFDGSLGSRVRNIGFEQDLSALCQSCDAYVNLHRNGGGTSSQTAILNRLPVVTRDFGHISDIVPPHCRHSTWDSYVGYIHEMMTSREFLNQEVASQQAFIHQHLDTGEQVHRLYEKLCEISTQY